MTREPKPAGATSGAQNHWRGELGANVEATTSCGTARMPRAGIGPRRSPSRPGRYHGPPAVYWPWRRRRCGRFATARSMRSSSGMAPHPTARYSRSPAPTGPTGCSSRTCATASRRYRSRGSCSTPTAVWPSCWSFPCRTFWVRQSRRSSRTVTPLSCGRSVSEPGPPGRSKPICWPAAGSESRFASMPRRSRWIAAVVLCLTFADLTDQNAQRREIERLGRAQAKRMLELEKAQAALTEQATHDALTGLPNRILLIDRITQALALGSTLGTVDRVDVRRPRPLQADQRHSTVTRRATRSCVRSPSGCSPSCGPWTACHGSAATSSWCSYPPWTTPPARWLSANRIAAAIDVPSNSTTARCPLSQHRHIGHRRQASRRRSHPG